MRHVLLLKQRWGEIVETEKYKLETFGLWSGRLKVFSGDKLFYELDNSKGDRNLAAGVTCKEKERLRLVLTGVQSVKDFVIEIKKAD